MQSNFLAKLFTITLLIFSLTVTAQFNEEHEGSLEEVSLKTKIKESINHHLLDTHDFIFFSDSETGKHYGFSLPVILWDEGFQLFSSSKYFITKFINKIKVAEFIFCNFNYLL